MFIIQVYNIKNCPSFFVHVENFNNIILSFVLFSNESEQKCVVDKYFTFQKFENPENVAPC